jgi:predicted CoA-binding protein
VDIQGLADIIQAVSELVTDFPEITEVDLNPVLATEDGATAVDARFIVDFDQEETRPPQFSKEEILEVMTRMFKPRAIAVVGASEGEGKIGNSVMKNLVNGGFEGEIYPINPKAETILGKKAYNDIKDLPDGVDLAVFAIPAKFVVDAIAQVGDKGIPAAVLIPSGFAETGEEELQHKLQETAREHGVRFIGPNIYGIYYLPQNMSAAFTTPYDVQGTTALASQSGGIGMGILGFARSTKLGVAAIVGLGNKADIDEDDLLTFFEQDDNTQCVALHMEDLKDGRSFVEVAQRVSKKICSTKCQRHGRSSSCSLQIHPSPAPSMLETSTIKTTHLQPPDPHAAWPLAHHPLVPRVYRSSGHTTVRGSVVAPTIFPSSYTPPPTPCSRQPLMPRLASIQHARRATRLQPAQIHRVNATVVSSPQILFDLSQHR